MKRIGMLTTTISQTKKTSYILFALTREWNEYCLSGVNELKMDRQYKFCACRYSPLPKSTLIYQVDWRKGFTIEP